jgi:hypothetical protein
MSEITPKVKCTITIFDEDDGTVGIKTAVEGKNPDGTTPKTAAADFAMSLIGRIHHIMSECDKKVADAIDKTGGIEAARKHAAGFLNAQPGIAKAMKPTEEPSRLIIPK